MYKQIKIGKKIKELQSPVTMNEIKEALTSIGDLKSPGIDGYGAKFFKVSWHIIKDDVVAAIQEFFRSGKMMNQFNKTVITLIPKNANVNCIKDYRPIAGCTTFYKIIARILTARLGKVMQGTINLCQAAFVPGQQIHNHIMLAYELIRGYGRKSGTPRCMLQLDLQKAYDMVDWRALKQIMTELGIPNRFIDWIMATVQSVSYSFNINGELTQPMPACRGIRQGDPISPLLFVIMMEYMSRLLVKMQQDTDFKFHANCKKMGLSNLTFADDVLLFCRGDTANISLMMNTVNRFSMSTGLVVNPQKCKFFCGGIEDNTKVAIKMMTGFEEGVLPVKYLGVPLTCKRLTITHYLPLIDKIVGRIKHWTSKLLSYADRIQLIQSVAFAISHYWIQCFPIPKYVLQKIDNICRMFLWTGKHENSRKSPIAWTTVCKPRSNGGLNITNLTIWNQTNLIKCLWNICRKADNLWVQWIHTYYLHGKQALDVNIGNSWSWMIKNIMRQREKIHSIQQVWDNTLNSKKFPMKQIYLLLIEDDIKVPWRFLLHKNPARPRALFTTWMLCHGKLPTKDRLIRFGFITDPACSFCKIEAESICHLFFDCTVTNGIWCHILQWIEHHHKPLVWQNELNWVIEHAKRKGWRAKILNLAFAETVYGIWCCRNDIILGMGDYLNCANSIIDNITYRGWNSKPIRGHIASLMI